MIQQNRDKNLEVPFVFQTNNGNDNGNEVAFI